jgi:hypothetical protein
MAPIDRYLILGADAEISLAKSAAPKSISDRAEVILLKRQGYQTAVKGTNGFVCMVQRSWAAGIDDPEFWNPGIRSPICFNAPAARTYLPRIIAKTRLALAGKSKAQIAEAIRAALDKGELPSPGNRRDVLRDVQGWLPQQSRWTLAFALDVFCPTN